MTAAAVQTNPHNVARTALEEHERERIRHALRYQMKLRDKLKAASA